MNNKLIWITASLVAVGIGIALAEIFSNEDGRNTDDWYSKGFGPLDATYEVD